MDFREREISFREADRRYAELKRQLDAGTITTEEFDAQRRRLMVQDDKGRWWAKSRKTGEWNYHDGSAWVRGMPPSYQPPRAPLAESTPVRQSQLKQGERLPLPQTTLGSAPIQDQNRGKQHRVVPHWVIIASVLLGVVALAGIGAIGLMFGKGSDSESGYDLVKDDSGNLSVEVPSGWDDVVSGESAGGEKGSNWSSFVGDRVGPSISAVNDRNGWFSGSVGHQGIYTVASKKLAQSYTVEELVALGPNDYSSSCEAGTPQDFDRSPYSGKILEWNNCGGESDHVAITLAAAPENRECVVVAQIGGYFRTQTDEESIQHVLDTLETDCSRID